MEQASFLESVGKLKQRHKMDSIVEMMEAAVLRFGLICGLLKHCVLSYTLPYITCMRKMRKLHLRLSMSYRGGGRAQPCGLVQIIDSMQDRTFL